MKDVNLTLPYPPSVNNMYGNRRNGGRILTQAGYRFKSDVAAIATISRSGYFEGEVRVSANVYRARKSGDLDNRLKAVLDALTGVCWKDDDQVVEIHAYRYDDKSNPRVEVQITAITK